MSCSALQLNWPCNAVATSACCRFGESLETSEQEWLVWEINQKVAELKGAAPTMEDMPPEDTPEVRAAASMDRPQHVGAVFTPAA